MIEKTKRQLDIFCYLTAVFDKTLILSFVRDILYLYSTLSVKNNQIAQKKMFRVMRNKIKGLCKWLYEEIVYVFEIDFTRHFHKKIYHY